MDYTKFPKIIALSDAMCSFEGGGPGLNNPGNIRCIAGNESEWNHFSIGQTDNFCNFPSRTVGKNAHLEKLYNIAIGSSSVYNNAAKQNFNLASCRDLTIAEMIYIYAPYSDGNNPNHYADTVCRWASLQRTDIMSSLLSNTSPEPPQASPQGVKTIESTSVPMAFILWQRFFAFLASLFK